MSDLDVQNINSKTGNSAISIADDGTTTVGTFTSTGIDDNATSTAITIDSSQKATFSTSVEATTSYRAYDSVAAAYRNVLRYDSGDLRLETGSSGSEAVKIYTGGTESMRIDSSGNLLVGSTSSTVSAGVKVYNNAGRGRVDIGKTAAGTANAIANYHNLTYVGGVNYSDTATSFPTSSDVRLKENIVDAPAGNIDAIRVRSFDWKADGSHQTYGMVAQELVDVAPEAVSQGETEDDMWGVDYSKLVPMMIKEIQDLKAEVAALKGA